MAKNSQHSSGRCFIPVIRQNGIELPFLTALNKSGLKAYRELAEQLRVLQQELPNSVRGPLMNHHSSAFQRFTSTYMLVRPTSTVSKVNVIEPSAARRLWDASLRLQGDTPIVESE